IGPRIPRCAVHFSRRGGLRFTRFAPIPMGVDMAARAAAELVIRHRALGRLGAAEGLSCRARGCADGSDGTMSVECRGRSIGGLGGLPRLSAQLYRARTVQ